MKESRGLFPKHSFLKTMTASTLTQFDSTTREQILELSDDQLDAVVGGVDVMEGEDDSWWYKRMGLPPHRF